MSPLTRNIIINKAKEIFASRGYDGLSMRTLAEESGVGLSSIYHFFEDKDVLLKAIFDTTNTELGRQRYALPHRKSAAALLKDRIKFQFDHIEDVVFVLKYFIHYRPDFTHLDRGYVPAKAYLHIEEVLHHGNQTGEFNIPQSFVAREAKVVTHAINGFLLEYFPNPPRGKELSEVSNSLHQFIIRSLTATKEVSMKQIK